MAAHSFYSPDAPGTAGTCDLTALMPAPERGQLRFLTCGSVDDGKSTLLGRLLFEVGAVPADRLAALEQDSRRFGTTGDESDFALLVDGLEDERGQGITIDVAHRYFATAKRSFVAADTPGHETYTRNMATAASNADVAVILVDARKGVLAQTKRHATICALMGVAALVLAVNKIDLVGYDEAVFDRIVGDFAAFAARLSFSAQSAFAIVPIPLSARHGDNLAARGGNTPWYRGPSLLEHLETVEVAARAAERPLRYPIQSVTRPDLDFRGYAGTLGSGSVRPGDRVRIAESRRETRVARIVTADGERDEARAGDAVTLVLTDPVDLSRGDLLCAADAPAEVADQFQAHVVWMSDEPLLPGRAYLMRIGHRHVAASVTAIKHVLDVESLEHLAAHEVALNGIAVCNLSTATPIAFDAYRDDPGTGAFILIDRFSNATVGAGMIDFALMRAGNLHAQRVTVDKEARERLTGHKPAILWFTGLSGSGKSTIADIVERKLHAEGRRTYLLDGDNVRRGLNRDLGFTDADRVENIRRIGEVAKLFVDAGVIVLCAFISPFAAERQSVREMVGQDEFFEIFVDTALDTCMARDPKGLYAKARSGLLRNFTGLDSPYERPLAPDLSLETPRHTPEEAAAQVLDLLHARGIAG